MPAPLQANLRLYPWFRASADAMAWMPVFFLYFSERVSLQQVLLLEADRNGDGASDGQRVLLDGLRRPYGLDLFGDYLYVGEADGIGRIRFDADTGTAVGAYERVVNGLPTGGNHWRNPIRFGPDNLLYVTIGLIVSLMLAFAVNDGLRNSVLDSLGL